MKIRKSISRTLLLNMIIAAILPLIIVSCFTIFRIYKNFNEESKEIQENYINNQKNMLKYQVEQVIDLIELERSFIAKHSLEKINGKMNFQKEILEQIGKIRFGKDGYIFVVNFDGITLMNSTQKYLIGQNLWEMTDPNGVKVIQEERKAVENPEGDFIYYVWNKPSEEIPSPKISFMKGIHDWQWMVGAGTYVDEIDKVIAGKRRLLIKKVEINILKIGLVFIFLVIFLTILAKHFSKKIKRSFEVFVSFFLKSEIESIPISIDNLHFTEFKTLALSINRMIEFRKKAEKSLNESEEKFRSYIEKAPYGIFVADKNGYYVDVNETACIITGYSRAELLSKNLVELTPPEDHLFAKKHFETVVKTGISTGDLSFIKKDGSKNTWAFDAVKLSENHVLGFVIDITDRILTDKEIKSKSIELEIQFEKSEKQRIATLVVMNDLNENTKELKEEIIERKRAEQIQKVLYNISNAVTTTGTLKKLISKIRKELGTIIDTTNFYVALYDKTTDMLSLPYYVDEKDKFTSAPARKTLTKYVIETKKPLLANIELKKKFVKEGKLEHQGSLSKIWLGVPLKIEENVTGVIAVQSYSDEFAYNDSDMEMLEFISSQISISIERKKTEEEIAKHRDHLKDLVKERTKELEKSQYSLSLLLDDVNDINVQLQKTNTKLDSTNKEMEAFSYSVSHDLRAPLTRMDGFSQAILDTYSDKLDEQGKHFLNRIRSSSKHMAKLIDDMLALSRISRKDIFRQQLDLTQLAENISKELMNTEPKRKVDFKIKKGLKIKADQKFIIILLQNLLGNAFKFTGKEKNAVIEFGKKSIDKKEIFFIKDNGDGFDMKYYDKIYIAFQRLHHEEDFPGTGIGLAIVQRIINKHGGKIWAESEMGKGSVFYFRLG